MNSSATSSGLLAASASVSARPAYLANVQLIADGTNACNVIVYDSENSSVSGKTVLAKLSIKATDTAQDQTYDTTVIANRGIYCVLSGTGAECIVHYVAG